MNLQTIIKKLCSLFVVAIFINLTLANRFIHINQMMYYALIFTLLATLLLFTIKRVNILGLVFVLFSGLSLLVNTVPEYFNATERWLGFGLVFILFGPLISNTQFVIFRQRAFNLLLKCFQAISVLSFFWFLLSLPNLGRGIFTGISLHSMILGPVAALGALYAVYCFLHKKQNKFNVLIFIASFICLLLASSRGALLGFFFALAVLLFLKYNIKFFIYTAGLSLIVMFFPFSLENKYTQGFIDKGETNTRAVLWVDRINEFKAKPIFGVGFGTLDPEISVRSFQEAKGTIEPGSSYLAILSMTGLIGFIPFFFLNFSVIFKLLKRRNIAHNQLPVIILCFFSIHLFVEGYIFASGSIMCMFFFLSLGVAWDLTLLKNNENNILA